MPDLQPGTVQGTSARDFCACCEEFYTHTQSAETMPLKTSMPVRIPEERFPVAVRPHEPGVRSKI